MMEFLITSIVMRSQITRLLNDLYQEIQTQHVINVEELNKNRMFFVCIG
ncbi:Uncharacterized protein BWGO95_02229 [Bacillus mycoides]|uniref:Uncharacterized protein n=1 Tax=Bacillus mycoides TaxID=1405 RepID=A0A1C4D3D7_BACMY|nr:Uncharacterized protein BWGO95_02229 [Bacillus mycoides]SCC25849.1 Uncharacterized protein BW664_02356 [Bacillus mycoides]